MIEKTARKGQGSPADGEIPPELLRKAQQLAQEISPLLKALAKH